MLAERLRRAVNIAFMTLFTLRLCSAQLENITFDSNERGWGKYGDLCYTNLDCEYSNFICDNLLKICVCHPDLFVTDYVSKCGKPAKMNEPCEFDEQCQHTVLTTICRNKRCVCAYDMVAEVTEDGNFSCVNPYRVYVNTSESNTATENKCSGHPNDDVFALLLLFHLLTSVFINIL